ncbi:hypothetical protein [Sulfobacillus harzensis]|uniref:Uncharacterized protein n=1 Tax=Sulfobacillus harzensis TaxID=2729629 RepID=A0A7Y0L0K9_9FIRM|nr:hypothetical protein [Sulfobacillus harzensis]NMP20752.1 hypothetical protein [Sulfobacillus harzensis]
MTPVATPIAATVLLEAAAVLIPGLDTVSVTGFSLDWTPERVQWMWSADDGTTDSQTMTDPARVAQWDRFVRTLCVLPDVPMDHITLGVLESVSWVRVVWTPPLNPQWQRRDEILAAVAQLRD